MIIKCKSLMFSQNANKHPLCNFKIISMISLDCVLGLIKKIKHGLLSWFPSNVEMALSNLHLAFFASHDTQSKCRQHFLNNNHWRNVYN